MRDVYRSGNAGRKIREFDFGLRKKKGGKEKEVKND